MDVSIHDPLSVVILVIDWVIMDDVTVNLVRLGDNGGSPAHGHAVSRDITELQACWGWHSCGKGVRRENN